MNETSEIIQFLNPWWKTGKISPELARPFKRESFGKVKGLLKYRQIILLSGLRRVGKTTLLYQLIEEFLQKEDAKKIFYFTFDKKAENILQLLELYRELTQINHSKEKIYVFLDEITKLAGWAEQIKLIYDAAPHIKFYLSSSSSINLEEEAIKNLAGRYFLVNIMPLNFREYLELKEKDSLLSNARLHEKEIKAEFKMYLLRSFPEIVLWLDELLIKDYLRTTIIDKVIKSDLPDRFKNINKDLLFTLLELFYKEPGVYLDYDNLSRNLKISKKTLFRHIFYLEFSYLIRKVKNFRPSSFSAARKLQRVYPYWWSLAYCYGANEDKIMENLVASALDLKYYWREAAKEIDFLNIDAKKIIPVEVKNKEVVAERELKNMLFFLKEYKLSSGFLVYKGEEKITAFDKKQIKFIPFWKFLLESIK